MTEWTAAPDAFSGKEADDEVGVVYFGERYLIPRIGRWASPDPLHVHAVGGGEALNSYHYVAGNLLQARDPLGLHSGGDAEGSEDCDCAVDGEGETRNERIEHQNNQMSTFEPAEAPAGWGSNTDYEWAVHRSGGELTAYWRRPVEGGNWEYFGPYPVDGATDDEVGNTLIGAAGAGGAGVIARGGRGGIRAIVARGRGGRSSSGGGGGAADDVADDVAAASEGGAGAQASVPGRVQSRINVARGPTRFTPLRDTGNPVQAGMDHVIKRHFGFGNTQSQFTITPSELRGLLQSRVAVQAPARPVPIGDSTAYVRTVDLSSITGGRAIGVTRVADGRTSTSVIQVFTDRAGNLITAFPVPAP